MAHENWNLRIHLGFPGTQTFTIGKKGGQGKNARQALRIIKGGVKGQHSALRKASQTDTFGRSPAVNLILDKIMYLANRFP